MNGWLKALLWVLVMGVVVVATLLMEEFWCSIVKECV